MALINFFLDCLKEVLKGGRIYWIWMLTLVFFAFLGVFTYIGQFQTGLIQTGMSDQVSWGLYVANFVYLVGMAAAAVIIVIPTYIFSAENAKKVVILGEGLAVAATVMCMLFVAVDMGRPDRLWHLLPVIGRFNWPLSLLTWDVLVLQGYMLLNLLVPMYILYSWYAGKKQHKQVIFIIAVVSMFWAISIHTVTAFLFSSNSARPFWHIALLAPRFITSAFTAGPAFIILSFLIIRRFTQFDIPRKTIDMLAIIVTIAMQVNLFMLGSEIFTEFYAETSHSAHAHYLFFGLNGLNGLVPWMYSAIAMNLAAVVLLMIHKTRLNTVTLSIACLFAVVGVWIEKGMGFVVPGFIPTPLGEIFEYTPTFTEVKVTMGVWAIGLVIFTVLVKAAIPIQNGRLRYHGTPQSASSVS